MDYSGVYDRKYYETGCGRPYRRDEEWLAFFRAIAKKIQGTIRPGTVLDAGCAMGFLVEELRGIGIEAYGMDISEYAIGHAHPSIREYCRVGSLADPLPRRYDLIVSIEVLEHMPVEEGEAAVRRICQAASDVLFSSSPRDRDQPTHINVHAPEYWAELFAQEGFFRDLDFDASFITPWAMRFQKRSPTPAELVADYESALHALEQDLAGFPSLHARIDELVNGYLRLEEAAREERRKMLGEMNLIRARNEDLQSEGSSQAPVGGGGLRALGFPISGLRDRLSRVCRKFVSRLRQ